ncbi:hypothetical protein FB451DRAFT_1567199 [Mycena latifolia]|nr:hypothetical protein FB451DRAFT_1567199 [Mycena latifolia]
MHQPPRRFDHSLTRARGLADRGAQDVVLAPNQPTINPRADPPRTPPAPLDVLMKRAREKAEGAKAAEKRERGAEDTKAQEVSFTNCASTHSQTHPLPLAPTAPIQQELLAQRQQALSTPRTLRRHCSSGSPTHTLPSPPTTRACPRTARPHVIRHDRAPRAACAHVAPEIRALLEAAYATGVCAGAYAAGWAAAVGAWAPSAVQRHAQGSRHRLKRGGRRSKATCPCPVEHSTPASDSQHVLPPYSCASVGLMVLASRMIVRVPKVLVYALASNSQARAASDSYVRIEL